MLSSALSAAVRSFLADHPTKELREVAAALSHRYRAGSDRWIASELEAAAYVATRMPATYAVTTAVLRQLRLARPDFEPSTMADIGAGPGTATFAALALFPTLGTMHLIEPNPYMRAAGRQLAELAGVEGWHWSKNASPDEHPDLLIAAYVLNEVRDPTCFAAGLRAKAVVLIEPGTPTSFEILRAVRTDAVRSGRTVVAPCTHHERCPMQGARWCHVVTRLNRDRTHRVAKDAELGYEDEPFTYLVLSDGPTMGGARVVGRPRRRRGLVSLEVCSARGLSVRTVARSQSDFRDASRARWGDRLR